MDKIARIRQEIERHRQAIRVLNEHTAPEQMSKTCAIFQYSDSILSALNSFLDTLSEEPDKSLEEAAENYIAPIENDEGLDYINFNGRDIKDAFIAGWKCRDDKMPMPEDTVLFNKGVAEGRRLEREDMLKDAVECELVCIKDCLAAILPMKEFRWTVGDKVRIIVLKEEEE